MTEKICPVCNRPNLESATRCWYCQSLLEEEPGAQRLPASDQDTGSGEENHIGEVPEWLARIRQRKAIEEMQQTRSLSPESIPPGEEPQSEPVNQPENEPVSKEPDTPTLPSWLQGLGTPRHSEGVTKSLQPEDSQEPENFNWLEKLQSWKARDEEESESESEPVEKAAEQASAETSAGDWLTEFLAPAAEPGGEPVPGEPESAAGLSADDRAAEGNQAVGASKETDIPDETFDFFAEAEDNLSEENPEPLKGAESTDSVLEAALEAPESQLPAEPFSDNPDLGKIEPSGDSSDLDWLTHNQEPEPEQDLKAIKPPAQGEVTPPLEPFLGVKKSDWTKAAPEPVIEPEPEGPDETVEPAVLPAWMENLRPIESIPGSSAIQSVEAVREGPLAGIEGALEGAGLGGAFEKPPIYTNKVQVTDRQSLRAELLQNLLSEQAEVKTVQEVKKTARSKWLKAVVSLIFLAVVFAVLIMAPGVSLLPALFPPETANAYRLVNDLSSDKPVLIAADFEAGLSAEIGLASQAILEHLMLRNIPIAVLSTNPVGSTLMEGMMAGSQGVVSSYDTAARVVHFGYLSGGSVGIQGLTSNLRATLPYDRDLFQVWTNPVLQNVQSLADLGALVVVTDDADTGRYWVEQAQSALKGVPLILVTSAQAAPMLQAYYSSGQVSAIVAGISGGSAYEQMMNLPGNSSYFFGAYQALILVAAALILVGGIVSLLKPAEMGSKG